MKTAILVLGGLMILYFGSIWGYRKVYNNIEKRKVQKELLYNNFQISYINWGDIDLNETDYNSNLTFSKEKMTIEFQGFKFCAEYKLISNYEIVFFNCDTLKNIFCDTCNISVTDKGLNIFNKKLEIRAKK
jgi:hypothetical protein